MPLFDDKTLNQDSENKKEKTKTFFEKIVDQEFKIWDEEKEEEGKVRIEMQNKKKKPRNTLSRKTINIEDSQS